jgi:hypothetical protein
MVKQFYQTESCGVVVVWRLSEEAVGAKMLQVFVSISST